MATWEEATIAGNATLTLASQMLPSPWVLSLPLDDVVPAGDQFCEAVVVALHVSGVDPAGPVSAVVLAVPEGVASAVADVQTVSAPAYHPADPEDATEEILVGLLLADPAFVAQRLATTTPGDATLVAFSEPPGLYPHSGELFTLLTLNELLSQGSLIHLDIGSTGVRVFQEGYESEGAFYSSPEDAEGTDLRLVVTRLSHLGEAAQVEKQNGSSFSLGIGRSTCAYERLDADCQGQRWDTGAKGNASIQDARSVQRAY
eukprot:4652418-Amphidinium_carterae.1